MGFFRFVGRHAKQQALHLAYATHIVAGARIVRRSYRRAFGRTCPKCRAGYLHPFSVPVDGQQQPFRGCDNCDYYEARDVRRDDDSLSRLREIAEERLQDMGGEEIALQTRRFRRLSRIWYALALLVAAGALALVMLQLFGLTFVFLLLFSINLAAQGMAASYRYWQLSHRTLFVRGAFRQWLRNGEWII